MLKYLIICIFLPRKNFLNELYEKLRGGRMSDLNSFCSLECSAGLPCTDFRFFVSRRRYGFLKFSKIRKIAKKNLKNKISEILNFEPILDF